MPKVCVWKQSPDPDDKRLYSTSCGEVTEFMDGGPRDNNYQFCPYCGLKIKENHA